MTMTRRAQAPGRVNLIGEHIDLHGGTVLPMALQLGVTVSAEQRADGHDLVRSAGFAAAVAQALDAPAQSDWTDAARGALQQARRLGWTDHGWTLTIASDLPVGAGLSSSAATIIAVLRCFAPGDVPPTALARYASAVENDFLNVPCGIMDQMAIAHAAPGEALMLDTRSLAARTLAIPAGWDFCVVHSGEARVLADGSYAARVAECEAARAGLELDWLCDARTAPEHLWASLPDPAQRRARHVASEQARVLEAVAALERADMRAFGALMGASHASLRDDFAVSTPGIDALTADALALGAAGARLTGAGFGGCIVALLREGERQDWWRALGARHPNAWLVA